MGFTVPAPVTTVQFKTVRPWHVRYARPGYIGGVRNSHAQRAKNTSAPSPVRPYGEINSTSVQNINCGKADGTCGIETLCSKTENVPFAVYAKNKMKE